jgi:uncharacterized protein YigE (DUF2233 family)
VIRFSLLFLTLTGTVLCAPVTEERVEHAGSKFRVVRTDPGQVRIVWKDEKGIPYRTFDRVQAGFAKRGKTVRFLMNGGIYEIGGIPCGLHVENGETLHQLNLADAPGNFFLKPNGVFRIDTADGGFKAFVSSSETFPNDSQTQLAVQSGPLLLANGLRHPAFKEGSPNKLHRNGIGVDDKGRVVFAITDRGQDVNLWDFAGLFLKLGCRNALFLDGDISQMSVNPDKPVESNQFSAIFVIVG